MSHPPNYGTNARSRHDLYNFVSIRRVCVRPFVDEQSTKLENCKFTIFKREVCFAKQFIPSSSRDSAVRRPYQVYRRRPNQTVPRQMRNSSRSQHKTTVVLCWDREELRHHSSEGLQHNNTSGCCYKLSSRTVTPTHRPRRQRLISPPTPPLSRRSSKRDSLWKCVVPKRNRPVPPRNCRRSSGKTPDSNRICSGSRKNNPNSTRGLTGGCRDVDACRTRRETRSRDRKSFVKC